MADEEVWMGVNIDDDSTVDPALYQEMKDFLRDYFCSPSGETQPPLLSQALAASSSPREASS